MFVESSNDNPDIDVEAQSLEVGGSGARETGMFQSPSETMRDPSQTLLVSDNRVGRGRSETPISNDDQSKNDDGPGSAWISAHVGHDEAQGEKRRVTEILPGDGRPPDDGSGPEPRMIGDFDGSANSLWTLYGKEAKNRDQSKIETLKLDMDGVLLFAGIFSQVLTAFIIDSKQNLNVDPQAQMVYYLQQNVAMLDQISRQLFTIAPQFTIPSTPLPTYPDFQPQASDIRVNVFWFMSLIFSLASGLLATLVQQWVRNYMHVFQQYSLSLKSARLRQFLNEGLEGWYMPAAAETVHGLLHVSLFLFFAGLCDFVLGINTVVGVSTVVPIAITSLLYVFTTFSPVIYPQSPYQNSFSGLCWYMVQKFGGRRFKDNNSGGALKSVSPDMARGQMQLAMEESKGRMKRDGRAVRWLVSNMTEDVQMEEFAMAIPGSFNAEWGEEMWKKVSIEDRNKSTSGNDPSLIQRIFGSRNPRADTAVSIPGPPSLSIYSQPTSANVQREDTMRELSARVRHLLDTCKNPSLFAREELRRRRTRACVETTASLVFLADAKLDQFGDLPKLLGDIGDSQTVRESSLVGKDHSFVMRWTCLSLVAIRPILKSTSLLHNDARLASQGLERSDNSGEGRSSTHLEKVIETFNRALKCLDTFSGLPILGGYQTEERVKEILRRHESQISELEQIDIESAELRVGDWSINSIQQSVDRITHGIITRQLPGIKSDISDTESDDFHQFIKLFRDPHTLLFIFPLRNLRRIRSFAQTLRNILQGQKDDDTFQRMIMDLREFEFPRRSHNLFYRQLWRLQDLQDGGGLGFTVELFFLALKQLLSKSSSKESHSTLYISTFRAITSDWSDYNQSLGTQKLLLDMIVPYRGIIFGFEYPSYIVTAFLAFLGNILEGQTGVHIDEVTEQLTDATRDALSPPHRALATEALGFILAVQSPS